MFLLTRLQIALITRSTLELAEVGWEEELMCKASVALLAKATW
jgi:hypothetical protein